MNIACIILGLIVIGQIIERHIYSRKVSEQMHDYMVAIMSRNTQEYITTKITEQVVKTPEKPTDEVPIELASDEEFTNHIKEINQ